MRGDARVRVLGVDPGLTRCGVAVLDGETGRVPVLVAVGVLRTPSDRPTPERLLQLHTLLQEWIDRHGPDAVTVERVFADVNVASVMGTAQAAGIAMLCAAARGIPVTTHTPTEVKAAITGSGRADKAQVATMDTRVLRLAEPPRPADATDALALAVCQLWRGSAQNRLAAAAEQARRGSRTAATARRAGPRQRARA